MGLNKGKAGVFRRKPVDVYKRQDETVVKIQGKKHYLWLIVDAETRFVLGVSPHRE